MGSYEALAENGSFGQTETDCALGNAPMNSRISCSSSNSTQTRGFMSPSRLQVNVVGVMLRDAHHSRTLVSEREIVIVGRGSMMNAAMRCSSYTHEANTVD